MLPCKREGEGKESQIREAGALHPGHELHIAMAGGGSHLCRRHHARANMAQAYHTFVLGKRCTQQELVERIKG